MAVLAWIKSKKVFLKVQAGTGDALSSEDLQEGFVDYVLWSTFEPDVLDFDEELDMNCIDSGMVMSKSERTANDSLLDCYSQAFGTPYNVEDVLVLIEER